ncbi:Metalloproteinase inhibitor 2 [Myotis brandtii]|uniref:Metalloproteinase inhibitor 2 n=1 Tax=Myotis brandtii TaxID=109478 RepID=S7NMV0_MYOBR|nr:Metalloproteinase inhibitor 2 [Myotis brandtii]
MLPLREKEWRQAVTLKCDSSEERRPLLPGSGRAGGLSGCQALRTHQEPHRDLHAQQLCRCHGSGPPQFTSWAEEGCQRRWELPFQQPGSVARDPRQNSPGAKVVSEKEVGSGNDVYGNPIKRIQYEIKQIKMFKGPDRDIEFIYTAPSSAICGVSLDVGGKKEYLIAGKADGNGKMHITLCDFIVPWDTLSTTQKKSLNHRYQMGCECKITRCPMIPCYISSVDECLWMDWVTEKSINGHQAKFFACIKRNDGSCAWYRGAAPPKQEFLDIQDP